MHPETYFLFMDETNVEPSNSSEFFIYGGAIVPQSSLEKLHEIVEEVRKEYGYKDTDKFKFAPHSRPKQVEPAKFRAAKRDVMAKCANLGIEFVACLVLHDIAKKKKKDQLIQWGANTVLGAFNQYLQEKGAKGVVVADRFPGNDGFSYCREKFQTGLTFPGGTSRKLENVLLYSFSCDGASHAMSAIDILLGGFRYCVNKREAREISKTILRQLARMIWSIRRGNSRVFSERGLRFRPKEIRCHSYRERYNDLITHLNELWNEGAS